MRIRWQICKVGRKQGKATIYNVTTNLHIYLAMTYGDAEMLFICFTNFVLKI